MNCAMTISLVHYQSGSNHVSTYYHLPMYNFHQADDDDYLLVAQAYCNRPKGGHDDDRDGLVAGTHHHFRKDGRVGTILCLLT